MKTILFYGDSNTYGYDPRDFSGGVYPYDVIWTNRIAEAFPEKWKVVNEGLNGRRIPFPGQYGYAERLLDSLRAGDVFAVMLGTNDILMTLEPDAQIPLRNMELFLKWLLERKNSKEVLLIAPPYAGRVDAPDQIYRDYYRECVKMNLGFQKLALQYGVMFTDAGKWNLRMAFDMGHLSEAGHAGFSQHMIEMMNLWE